MLEQLYAAQWIRKGFHGIFVGFIYSVIGIFVSILLFPNYAGIVSLGFVSVLLIPTLNSFLQTSEKSLAHPKRLSISRPFVDHWDIIKASLFLFLGTFIAYMLIGFLFRPEVVTHFFGPQLKAVGLTGFASSSGQLFSGIMFNNLLVFVVCFVISIMFGAGALIFLIWNASVWGIALSYFVREAVAIEGGNPFLMMFSIALPFLPHLITEALSYVNASIVGGIVSRAVLTEKFSSKGFYKIIIDAFVFMGFGFLLVVLGAILEVYVFPLIA